MNERFVPVKSSALSSNTTIYGIIDTYANRWCYDWNIQTRDADLRWLRSLTDFQKVTIEDMDRFKRLGWMHYSDVTHAKPELEKELYDNQLAISKFEI